MNDERTAEIFSLKKQLRKEILSVRDAMPRQEVDLKSAQICDIVLGLEEYKQADCILAYMSYRCEVDITSVIQEAVKAGKEVFIPKVESRTEMQFYKFDNNFVVSRFGIREPASSDYANMFDPSDPQNKEKHILMILPGVAFDVKKNRLGYGGGFYDSYIEKMKGHFLTKSAVCFENQITDFVPVLDTDIPVDRLITEKRLI